MRYFTGIGSRSCPESWCGPMARIAQRLTALGYVLRSGGAAGADSFFEAGAGAHAEIYRPAGQGRFTPAGARVIVPRSGVAYQCALLASMVHPRWDLCNDWARLMHMRNCCQVYGQDLDSPSEFVLAWAPATADGEVTGGTATAWKLAGIGGIPRYNLSVQADVLAFKACLVQLESVAAYTAANLLLY